MASVKSISFSLDKSPFPKKGMLGLWIQDRVKATCQVKFKMFWNIATEELFKEKQVKFYQ